MLEQAVHIIFYTYKWLQFAVADIVSVVLVVPTIATESTCCLIIDNLFYILVLAVKYSWMVAKLDTCL